MNGEHQRLVMPIREGKADLQRYKKLNSKSR